MDLSGVPNLSTNSSEEIQTQKKGVEGEGQGDPTILERFYASFRRNFTIHLPAEDGQPPILQRVLICLKRNLTFSSESQDDYGVRVHHQDCYPCAWWKSAWNLCARDCCGRKPSYKLMTVFFFLSLLISVGLFIAGGIYAADYEKTVTYQWHTAIGVILVGIAIVFTWGYEYPTKRVDEDLYLLAADEIARDECLNTMRMGGVVLFAGAGILATGFEVIYFWFKPPEGHPIPTSDVPAGLLILSTIAMEVALFFRYLSLIFYAYSVRDQHHELE